MTQGNEEPVKLFYYPATGRANQIRLTLAAGGIAWEDVFPKDGFPPSKADKEMWQKLGGNTTTNIPMLQCGASVYTQSSAVLRVAARMGNLMPTEDEALYRTDKLIADADDFRSQAYKSFVPWGASKEDATAFIQKTVPLHFGNMERQLKEAGTAFFTGEELGVADIAIYDAVVNFALSRMPESTLEGLPTFPVLMAWKGRVEANPGISAYLKSEAYEKIGKFGPSTLGL